MLRIPRFSWAARGENPRSAPSIEPSCTLCGHRALQEDSPHEFAGGATDRWICAVCGAHHVSTSD